MCILCVTQYTYFSLSHDTFATFVIMIPNLQDAQSKEADNTPNIPQQWYGYSVRYLLLCRIKQTDSSWCGIIHYCLTNCSFNIYWITSTISKVSSNQSSSRQFPLYNIKVLQQFCIVNFTVQATALHADAKTSSTVKHGKCIRATDPLNILNLFSEITEQITSFLITATNIQHNKTPTCFACLPHIIRLKNV